MPDIQSSVKFIYSLSSKFEENGIAPTETGLSFKDYIQLSFMKYLIFLSEYDKSISTKEVALTNEFLDMSLTTESIQTFVLENTITHDSLYDSLAKIVKLFVTADSTFGVENGSVSLMFIQFLNKMTVEFISADGKCDEKQAYTSASILTKLRTMRNIIIGQRKRILNAPAAVIPDNILSDNITSDGKKSESSQKQEIPITDNDNCESLEELMQMLAELSGLEEVKKDLNSLINLLKVKKLREERGFPQSDISLHMVFSGNPGTGKTTVARLISKIYYRLGVLSKGHLIEVDRSGLVGGYVGQTAIKTKKICDSAIGGLLFIDEAYTLSTGGSNDFGIEAINTILKAMEDNRDDLVVIVAGYPDLMNEFLESNPGLRSRFNKIIQFNDYSPEELIEIFKNICAKSKLNISSDAENYTYGFFEKRCGKNIRNFANARDVRNYFEKAITNQADRIANIPDISDEDLMTIRLEDVSRITLD